MSSTPAWTILEGLADAHPGTVKADYELPRSDIDQAKPSVKVIGKVNGATVVRLAFRDGDIMADHSAKAPILIMGQSGSIDITVTEDATEKDGVKHVPLEPGMALHIDSNFTHSLQAKEAATATLIVLG